MLPSFSRLFRRKDQKHRLEVTKVRDLATYKQHAQASAAVHRERWTIELGLAESGSTFTTPGFCFPCKQNVQFVTDFLYSSTVINGKPVPNWRERVLCPICQMNNRTRASVQLLEEYLGAKPSAAIYLAEQVTPLYAALKKRFVNLTGSEYLGDKVPFGERDTRGVRNESITKLMFADDAFDFILNFDVLEHVPDVASGLREIHRTLAPNGKLLLSVPFLPGEQSTQIRAQLTPTGEIEHLMAPQYHGDPIADAGCLCFQDFGWDLLDQMREIGFVDVNMLLYWSAELGYYGVEQMMIVGEKQR